MVYDAVIIGGSAAGLTAAAQAAKGRKICVLERNDVPARKIYATGNGRCNCLNRDLPGAEAVAAELERMGMVLAEEEGGRLYPRCREASFAAEALAEAAEKAGAEIRCGAAVYNVQKNGQGFVVEFRDSKGTAYSVSSKKIVIASGGKAGIQLGCTGDGFKWASALGHRVVKPIPALVGLKVSDPGLPSGVRAQALVSIEKNGIVMASDRGELQFGVDYISGICVMNLSRWYRLDGQEDSFTLTADLLPEYEPAEVKNIGRLEAAVPRKLAEYCEKLCAGGAPGAASPAEAAKHLSFTVCGTRGWKEAQVTSGGVALDEIDAETFESKLVPGLYFAGEVLDYDGPCGGYNLGWAFMSGMKAGASACR